MVRRPMPQETYTVVAMCAGFRDVCRRYLHMSYTKGGITDSQRTAVNRFYVASAPRELEEQCGALYDAGWHRS